VVGLFVILFVLHLAAALLAKKRPRERERHVTMFSFLLLVPAILAQHLPPMILPPLSLFFAAYLHKAR
jgi:4-amino-4-deoxy-L-arabinose transferase-like glycosyltransferase